MTPDFMANATGMLALRGVLDPVLTRDMLVLGVDPGHLAMEALLELGSNVTDVSTGWLITSWALERVHMALVRRAVAGGQVL